MNAQEAINITEKYINDVVDTLLYEELEALDIVLKSAKFLHENLELSGHEIEDGTLKYDTPLYINPVAQEKLGIKGE